MFYVNHQSINNLNIKLDDPTQQELSDILTIMYTLYPNTKILREW